MSERVTEGEPRKVNRQECRANYTLSSTVDLKYGWSHNSTSLIYHNGVEMDDVFFFFLSFIEITDIFFVQLVP